MNLYLTKVELDYETAHKAGLHDSYSWHQWAWKAFPNRPQESRTFLTRLDDRGEGLRFLIQSHHLPTRPESCPSNAWEVKEIPDSFWNHETYRFSILANPTKKLAAPRNAAGKRGSGKRIPYSSREDLLGWLERKATQHGFAVELNKVKTNPRPRQIFVKKSKIDLKRITGLHGPTEFVGVLRVVNPGLFHESIAHGIGSAKAFGYGMLCLSPFDQTIHPNKNI